MKLLFLEFMVRNLGKIFSVIFLIYACLIAIRMVELHNVLKGVREEVNSSMPLKFLRDQFQKLKESCTLSNPLAVETRIEQIWIEYESRVQVHFSAINGYVYSIILWGFCGTIWGTIKAFSTMGEKLFQKDLAAAEALYTSLVAATIGAVMVTYIYSRYMYQKAKKLEGLINENIYRVITEEGPFLKKERLTDQE